MRKLILLLAVVAFSAVEMKAGYVPGYMGKRFSVGANASSFFFFDDYTGVSDMIFSTRFSYKSELAINYTIARKVSLGASFYYGNQRYKAGQRDYQDAGGDYHAVTLKEDYLRCKLMIYEFNVKIYRQNFIAPIGPYHQLGIGLVKYNASAPGDSLKLVAPQNTSVVVDVIDISKDPYSCVKLSYHIGYAAPVFSNCYLNLAIGVNFFRGGDSPKLRDQLDDKTYALGIMNKHLRRHNFLEFKIGFGWLAF